MGESRLILALSVIISLLIFLYVKLNREIRISFEYQLNVNSSPYIRVIPSIQKAKIDFQAKAKDLILIALKEKILNLNLEFEKVGNFKVALRDYIINEPNVKILKVYPETLTVFVEKIVQKQREVKVNVVGEVESVIVEPKFVNIIGSESQLIGISHLETEEIDTKNKNKSFEVKVAVKKPFKDIKIEPESVIVKCFIK